MAAAPQGRHGLTPFRLTDIPIAVRRQVGALLARAAEEDALLMERVAIERAVEYPSETLYWVPTVAYERERRARKRWT